MKKIFYGFIIFFGLIFASCTKQNDEQPQIRIVDMQGKPHHVDMRMPEMNTQAMVLQGAQQRQTSQAAQTSSQEQSQQVAQNTTAEVPDYGEVSSQTVQKTSQSQTSAKSAQSSNNSMLGAATTSGKNEEAQYDLAQDYQDVENQEEVVMDIKDDKKSETKSAKKTAKKSGKSGIKIGKVVPLKTGKAVAATAKSSRHFYVQIGSFSSLENANKSLSQMKKFHKGKVDTIEGEKTIYRVLLGPFPNRAKTNEMIRKIKGSGHEAILVKN